MIRKIIISWIAATSLILFSTQAFALLNFSVGVPLSHTFSGKYNGGDEVKSDGVSGYFIQVGIPILIGQHRNQVNLHLSLLSFMFILMSQ